MISFGKLIQKDCLKANETECYIINLENIDINIEIVNNNLCITLKSKEEPKKVPF